MAGGAGMQRNRQPGPTPNGQGGNNNGGSPPGHPSYQGPPPGHPQFQAYQAQFRESTQNYVEPPKVNHGPPQGSPPSSGNVGVSRPRSGGYDGPGEPSKQPPRQNPYAPGLGYDPARPAAVKERIITNTRVELPATAYKLEGAGYEFPLELPLRPGTNTTGKAIQVRLNQFKVSKWPQQDVYQYDVLIGSGAEARGKVLVVWKSQAVQQRLASLIKGPWLWDGNKIAWCNFPVAEQRILVDLDAEKGRTPGPGRQPDQVYVVIRPTKQIRMAVIKAYLEKQMCFTSDVLEAINFLDHAMRQWPSEQYTTIKRSFFSRGQNSYQLDNCIVAMKGVYTSMRLCDPKPSVGTLSTGLALNVDVANGTFWASQDLIQAARNYCGGNGNRGLSYTVFRDQLLPITVKGTTTYSEPFKLLRKMAKLKFHVKHRGKKESEKSYTIKGFTWEKGPQGAHAKNTSFTLKARQGRPEETITVYNYYKRQYNIDLVHWYLPLVKTTRDGMFPMELCVLQPNQRYMYKLGSDQTAAMIKFAVTRPKERIESIKHGVGMLKWHEDRYLKHFGIEVDPNMTLSNARLLQNPEVQYDRAKVNPGTSGRWDLRGKKFLFGNPEPLKSWGVVVVGGVQETDVQNFLKVFIQTYIGHGGRVENKNPIVYMGKRDEDLGNMVAAARTAAGNQSQALPQILFFVLPGRDSFMYERLKKNMECRFAMVSQMMNCAHVKKAQPQYCSNVCMKVNAKLGGTTCKVVSAKNFFARPTMIIGADVSHASPGSPQASMAALTMSFDKDACRYAASVQTNGIRVEMITESNINSMMMPLFDNWVKKVGGGQGPHHIYYFRDGVSEGQYAHVINREVAHMKKAIASKYGANAATIKWTVIVCTKRHHIRFFPKEGDMAASDKNGNALPGTLVERDVTHPFEYDFYLSAHSAIQGTARPVHYHVILDEAQVPVNEFHKLVYQHCYQYMRSTTPVSLYPAVYYAHLASNRARAHEANAASEGPRGGQKFEETRHDTAVAAARGGTAHGSSQTGSSVLTEAKPLLPLGNPDQGEAMLKIRTGMWYI